MSSMRMEFGQHQTQKQVQILAPRMIQSMEILQMPLLSLVERLQTEMDTNPVLELRDVEAEAALTEFKGTDSLEPAEKRDNEELVVDPKHGEDDFDRLEALSRDYGDFINEEHRPSRGGLDDEGDRKHDAMQNMADRPKSLQEHLEEQVPFLEAPPELEQLVRHVLAYIDRTGYVGLRSYRKKPRKKDDLLHEESARKRDDERRHHDEEEVFVPVSLEEIAGAYKVRPVTVEEVEEALHQIQTLDPPGVGARDLRECLLLQVTDEMPHAEVVRALIDRHLEDIQHNRLPHIQKETHFDLDQIREGIEELRRLNPRPGAAFEPQNNRYITPDIEILPKEDGTYEIKLLDDWVPEVHISRRYMEMARDRNADATTREFLKRKIQDAMWLKEAIEQRRNTLEKVTRAIIEHQKEFLDEGAEHIRPLKMQQIADQVGVHVTTVSRAVDDKYVQTPRGVFPLKRFFGGASHNNSTGEDIAWERIKKKLLDLIEKEDKTNPLSDEELVDTLEKEGFPIKRRTVTKYRKMLNIPSSRQRKDWALVAAAETNGHVANGVAASAAAESPEEDDAPHEDTEVESPPLAPALQEAHE